MRILVVSPEFGVLPDGSYRPGGIAQFSRCVARAVASWGAADAGATGKRVTKVGVMGLLDRSDAMASVMARYLKADAAPGVAVRTYGYDGDRVRMSAELAVRQLGYDQVMFLHLGVGRLANIVVGREVAFWLVGIECRKPFNAVEARAYKQADIRLSISTFSTDQMIAHNPTLPRAETVHLCVEPHAAWVDEAEDARTAEVAYDPSERKPAVLIVARMAASERYKGHDQLIEAWPQVVADKPDAELWIVGGGDDAERLAAKAAALPEGVRDQVKCLGRVSHEDLLRAYREARVFAMPSTGEGFGLVFCEAMQSGMPCICSHDSAAEIVRDGETGFVVDQTPAAIAEGCVKLLADDGLAASMSAAGKQRFEDVFTFDAYRRRLAAAAGLA